jgi:hypothetical protein
MDKTVKHRIPLHETLFRGLVMGIFNNHKI